MSDPVSAGGDERAYCYLRSALQRIEFLHGVHLPEPGDWRWTEKTFSLRIWKPLDEEVFVIPLFIPEDTLTSLGPVTVNAIANGVALPALVLDRPGIHDFPIPSSYLSRSSARIEFHLDKVFPPDELDQRERGLVIPNLEPSYA